MIVDSSAVIAILRGESDAGNLLAAIKTAKPARMSVASVLECHLVAVGRRGLKARGELDALLATLCIDIESVDADQLAIARDAFDRFGKGRHEAGLNFGDCFAYALSKASAEPLLFKGGDFAKTDVEAAA